MVAEILKRNDCFVARLRVIKESLSPGTLPAAASRNRQLFSDFKLAENGAKVAFCLIFYKESHLRLYQLKPWGKSARWPENRFVHHPSQMEVYIHQKARITQRTFQHFLIILLSHFPNHHDNSKSPRQFPNHPDISKSPRQFIIVLLFHTIPLPTRWSASA